MRLWPVVIVLMSGCGRIGFDAITATTDDDGGNPVIDGGASEDALGEFPAPALVAELADGSQYEDPSVTLDGLLLVFMRDRGGNNFDLCQSTRSDGNAPWTAPTFITELNTGGQETSPEVSPDGLSLYFTSNRGSGTSRNVWLSTRNSRADTWGTPALIAELSSSRDEANIAVRSDGLLAIIDSARDGERDLYRASNQGGTWSTPEAIPGLAAGNRLEGSPSIANNGTIYFHVTNAASTTFDVWRAVPDENGAYSAMPVPDLAGFSDPFISADGSVLYVMRGGELYVTSR